MASSAWKGGFRRAAPWTMSRRWIPAERLLEGWPLVAQRRTLYFAIGFEFDLLTPE